MERKSVTKKNRKEKDPSKIKQNFQKTTENKIFFGGNKSIETFVSRDKNWICYFRK